MKLSVKQRFWIVKRRLQGASVVFICQQAGILFIVIGVGSSVRDGRVLG